MAILLAAGASRRLGRPKQLLPIGKRTLLEHAIDCLLRTNVDRVIVVTGARSDAIASIVKGLNDSRLRCVENKNWAAGQASSLAAGLSVVQDQHPKAGALVALCDQPLIAPSHYQSLIDAMRPEVSVASTKYDSGGGVPACFAPEVLSEVIKSLHTGGAKRWIRRQPLSRVAEVECDQPISDIDTAADYEAIVSVVR